MNVQIPSIRGTRTLPDCCGTRSDGERDDHGLPRLAVPVAYREIPQAIRRSGLGRLDQPETAERCSLRLASISKQHKRPRCPRGQ
jgi:hypothetical protein